MQTQNTKGQEKVQKPQDLYFNPKNASVIIKGDNGSIIVTREEANEKLKDEQLGGASIIKMLYPELPLQ